MNGPRDGYPRDAESELRASLAAHARHAPTGELLAERIILQAESRPVRRRRGPRPSSWRTWTLPLVAAGSVAAVAVALVAVSAPRHAAAPVEQPAVSRPVPAPTSLGGAVPSTGAPSATSPAPQNPVGLSHFRAQDLSFVGDDDAWAVGTARCLADPAQTCSALAHTTDGTHWTGVVGQHSTPFNLAGVSAGCATSCVEHLRFVDDRTGYAFGPTALFMTTDGGVSWTRQAGGADALETLRGNVIRVSGTTASCGGTCPVVQTARIGSSDWSTEPALPGWPTTTTAVSLSRSGDDAYLLADSVDLGTGDPATQQGALYVSTDDGASWTARGEVCTSSGDSTSSADSVTLTTAAGDGSSGGAVAVGCVVRSSASVVTGGGAVVSDDQGAGFSSLVATAGLSPVLLAAASADDLLVVNRDGTLLRSTDGGVSWSSAGLPPVSGVAFLGFESATVGHLVAGAGATIWTTQDAGANWTAVTFP